jgi:hypothetical protein
MWDTCSSFEKLPIVDFSPIGENSPNVVTLLLGQIWLAPA